MNLLGDLEAAFLGVLGIIFLVSIISYFYTGGKVYLFYSMYAISLGLYLGYKFYFESFIAENGRYHYYESEGFSVFVQPLIYLNYYYFIMEFLDTKVKFPTADRVLKWMVWFNVFALVSLPLTYFLGLDAIHQIIYFGFRIAIALISIGLIIYLFTLKKDLLVNLIISGGIFLLVGGVMAMVLSIYEVYIWGIDPLVWMVVGILLELILFSCGLGYRTVQIQKDKNRLQNELIHKMKENEVMLENREELVRRDLGLALEKVKKETEEKVKTEFSLKEKEIELNVLRAQMNPHFLFNSLNSLKVFIQESDKEQAAEYLDDFSYLVRKTLDNSSKKSIPLSEELSYIKKYVTLENLRYDNSIKFQIKNAESLDLDFIRIPPMLLQPLVENSIWHGLSHSEHSPKELNITFKNKDEILTICVCDTGIGREEAGNHKTVKKKNSISIQNIKDRLNLLYPEESNVRISDNNPGKIPVGTKVEISFPI